MKKEYYKPSMMVTYYNAMDVTNLTLDKSYAIALDTKSGKMSVQSFTLHK